MTDDGAAPAAARVAPRAPLGAAYWRLWTSSGLSNLADGVLKVALPLVALGFTRSPALVAGVTLALTLPWLLFALPVGALADRLDRRRLMLGAHVARVLLLAGLVAVLALDLGSVWALYVVAFCLGAAETVYDTSAQSILPALAPREQLTRANGRLYAVELTANQFVGPPLGGVLVASGATLAFATPAGLWLAALGVLLLVRGRFRVAREGTTSVRADVAEGLRFLGRHRLLRTLAVMVGVSNFASSAVFAVFVLHAVGPGSPMGLSEQAYGLLLTTLAVGSLLGSFVAAGLVRVLGRARSLALTLVGNAALLGTPAVTTDARLVGAAFLLGGALIVVWNVVTVSLRQGITPDRLLGRVNSGYRLLAWGSMPLGAAAGGLLADVSGLPTVFATMAVLSLALLLAMPVVTDERMDAAERAAAAG
ncbi:Fucose permease [Geodermatophilus pulveris]|uniref:Fucose permease n=1 Tax=Geodermatophilus pulveris TaxID=1564159 RepID=A0A239DBS9_9ACTN|nr:MFS transporter [Geodermatophilus pulveris]SNS29143.1 Fucose permease [Geodermatophilus pulveris]